MLPGIKVGGDLLENTDMMRGEETELIGLSEKLQSGCIYVLPGSHSKLIKTDEQGRISSFVTTLTGEMIFALSQSTILKDAVDFSQTETDFEYLDSGYKYCCRKGINEALFKTLVLKNIFKASPCELYSLSAIVGILFLITRYAIRLISTVKPQKYACIAGGRFSPYISAVLKPSTMIAAGFKKHICFRIGLSKSTFQKTGVTQNPS